MIGCDSGGEDGGPYKGAGGAVGEARDEGGYYGWECGGQAVGQGLEIDLTTGGGKKALGVKSSGVGEIGKDGIVMTRGLREGMADSDQVRAWGSKLLMMDGEGSVCGKKLDWGKDLYDIQLL